MINNLTENTTFNFMNQAGRGPGLQETKRAVSHSAVSGYCNRLSIAMNIFILVSLTPLPRRSSHKGGEHSAPSGGLKIS